MPSNSGIWGSKIKTTCLESAFNLWTVTTWGDTWFSVAIVYFAILRFVLAIFVRFVCEFVRWWCLLGCGSWAAEPTVHNKLIVRVAEEARLNKHFDPEEVFHSWVFPKTITRCTRTVNPVWGGTPF